MRADKKKNTTKNKTIKCRPGKSVVKLEVGEEINRHRHKLRPADSRSGPAAAVSG
jgi:hypothetical protein